MSMLCRFFLLSFCVLSDTGELQRIIGHYYTPAYEVCGGILFSLFRSSVHPSVRTYVRSFVRLFVFLSQGQSFCVKVYKTSYFEDPLMDFIHIWHDGRYRSKVFISTIPVPGVTLGSRSRTSNFHK